MPFKYSSSFSIGTGLKNNNTCMQNSKRMTCWVIEMKIKVCARPKMTSLWSSDNVIGRGWTSRSRKWGLKDVARRRGNMKVDVWWSVWWNREIMVLGNYGNSVRWWNWRGRRRWRENVWSRRNKGRELPVEGTLLPESMRGDCTRAGNTISSKITFLEIYTSLEEGS